jgi:deazaflavin-dependent oxidoreductase (nitroreductase family)
MMESSDADSVWVWVGMHHVLLRTIGRRSGDEHKVALPFWRDPEGHRLVVASFAGAPKDPAWYVNLADKSVNPLVLVRVQGGGFWADAEILDGEDYAAMWDLLVVDRPHYADYKAKTDRVIPVVRLREVCVA